MVLYSQSFKEIHMISIKFKNSFQHQQQLVNQFAKTSKSTVPVTSFPTTFHNGPSYSLMLPPASCLMRNSEHKTGKFAGLMHNCIEKL